MTYLGNFPPNSCQKCGRKFARPVSIQVYDGTLIKKEDAQLCIWCWRKSWKAVERHLYGRHPLLGRLGLARLYSWFNRHRLG